MPESTPGAARHELSITRVFDAPRDLVFQAWTDPRHLAAWWGPRGFVAPSVDMDVSPGGRWRTCIRPEDGGDEYWCSGQYREVTPPERLVFTFAWEEPPGTRGDDTVVTVSFADLGGKTEMTFHQAAFDSVAVRDEHESGWVECFDDLAIHLAETRAKGDPA